MLIGSHALAHIANPRVRRGQSVGPRQRAVLDPNAFAAARDEISRWPGYEPTSLVSLSGIAHSIGIASVWYKDEAGRFGLGSFKALGGAYAVLRLIKREIKRRGIVPDVLVRELLAGRWAAECAQITVTCATDGNHGRSVAWGAKQFGCGCIIFLHATVSKGREDAIARYGAKIIRVSGNYDDAVRAADKMAADEGWFVVSDTSYPGYNDVPRDVMQGYTIMVDEAVRQFPSGERPTHAFLQGGVGGMAAAVADHLWEIYGADRPRIVVVEPDKAACLFESARAGKPTVVHGELDTLMAGLACGEVSLLAWDILDECADDFLTVPDAAAVECMRLLAAGTAGDVPLVAGESAVAGLAGLILAASDLALAQVLRLRPDSRVLLIGSEGATDPEVYARLVGRKPEDVRKSA